MIRRRIARMFLPALLVLVLAAAMASVLRTEYGARWLWSWASGLAPGSLRVDRLAGTLESGLALEGLVYENESTRVVVPSVRLRLSFDWLGLAVAANSLSADEVTVTLLRGRDPDRPDTLAESLSEMRLPFAIRLESVRVERLSIESGDGTPVLKARDVQVAARWHKRLSIETAQFRINGLQAEVAGTFDPSPPFRIEAHATGAFTEEWGGSFPLPGAHIEADLNGNLLELGMEASLDQPGIHLEGHWLTLLTAPDSRLRLTAGSLQWPPGGEEPDVTLEQVGADIAGTWNHYRLIADGTVATKALPAASVRLEASGNLEEIRLEKASLSNALADLGVEGSLRWSDGFQAQVTSAIEKLDLKHWVARWPDDQPLHGTVSASWEKGRAAFEQLDLAAGESGFHLTGEGVFDPGADLLTATLGWTGLELPLDSDGARFRSERGELTLSGRPDEWTAGGEVRIQAGEWPAGRLALEGQGNRESARIRISDGQILGGRIAGELSYQWTGRQPWSTRIEATRLDLSPLAGAWPGTLSGTVTATGQAEPLALEADIARLNGTLRGQPVEASGGIAFAAGQLRARDLRVASGPSWARLDGDARSVEGLHVSGNIESLALFADDAAGALVGEGRLSLDPARPLLRLDLTGTGLQWGAWGLDSIKASSLATEPGNRIDIAGLRLGKQAFESVSLQLGGAGPLDVIELEARRNETRVLARLAGTVPDWDRLPHATWSGRLETLSLARDPFGSLVLEQAADLVLGGSAIAVGPACLRGSLNGLSCFDFSWNREGVLEANATLDSVSLNVINLAVPTTLDFSQRMSGEIHWLEATGARTAGEVRIRLTPGLVTAAEGAADLSTGPGVLGFRVEDGQLLAGNLDIALPGVGAIDTDFTLPQVSLLEDSPIEGRVQVTLGNIGPFSDWIPGVDGLEGSINADIRVGGTAVNPALTGYASLVRGRVEIEPLGITVGDIRLAGAVFENDYTTLTGNFASGKGTGRINASVKFAEFLKPEIALELTGENLTVANVPDMTVRINPDLKVKWHQGALDINGNVLIPYARISPRYLPTTNASESDDLVIVAGQKKFSDERLLNASRLRINGSVSVELGEQIGVSFQRAKATLRGKTTFTWDNNLVPVGDGAYLVSGKISAYGQALEVEEGRVSFPLVPANNPHLNIKAEREIYGNVQIKKAGVLITGTLKRPVLETYTSPVTTEERALALLITGHDFDYDQGVGAVEVGLYIAPKVYVSYGIGLFDSQSVISVRYDLKRGWGIKATSGQRETGADISYTLDR